MTTRVELAVYERRFGLLNAVRGRRFWSLPTRFGVPELPVFVLLPALLPLVTEGQLKQLLGVAGGNLVLVGLAYLFVGVLVLRLPGEVRRIEHDAGADGPPLRRRQRFNVGVTLAVSQILQVLVVSTGVGAFFVAFGMLVISSHVYQTWASCPTGGSRSACSTNRCC